MKSEISGSTSLTEGCSSSEVLKIFAEPPNLAKPPSLIRHHRWQTEPLAKARHEGEYTTHTSGSDAGRIVARLLSRRWRASQEMASRPVRLLPVVLHLRRGLVLLLHLHPADVATRLWRGRLLPKMVDHLVELVVGSCLIQRPRTDLQYLSHFDLQLGDLRGRDHPPDARGTCGDRQHEPHRVPSVHHAIKGARGRWNPCRMLRHRSDGVLHQRPGR